jgi:uncharacterized membrane protein
MNLAYYHLAVNHVPVLAVAFGLLLQLLGMLRNSRDLQLGALCLYVIGAVSAVAAVKTGPGAAHVVMGLPGVEREFIHRHAEMADWAMIAAIATGVLALLAWFLPRWSLKAGKAASALCLLSALAAAGLMGWTANLGGQVRHTEIRAEAP